MKERNVGGWLSSWASLPCKGEVTFTSLLPAPASWSMVKGWSCWALSHIPVMGETVQDVLARRLQPLSEPYRPYVTTLLKTDPVRSGML